MFMTCEKDDWLFATHSFTISSFTSISLMTSCMRSNICWQHLTGFRRNFKALLIEIWWQGLSRSSSSGVKSLSTCNISCNFCFTLKKEGEIQEPYKYLALRWSVFFPSTWFWREKRLFQCTCSSGIKGEISKTFFSNFLK